MDDPEEIDEAEAAAAYQQEVEAAGQARLFPLLTYALKRIGPKLYVHRNDTGGCVARWCDKSGEFFVAENTPFSHSEGPQGRIAMPEEEFIHECREFFGNALEEFL